MPRPKLCSICLDCIVHHRGLRRQSKIFDHSDFDHHLTPESLQASYDAKCPICSPLWSKRPAKTVFNGKQPVTHLQISWAPSLELTAAYERVSVDPLSARQMPVIAYSMRVMENDEPYYTKYDLSDWTGSSASWALAAKWIHECSTQHRSCRMANKTNWWPTRLVDVGTRDGSPCRLITSAQHDLKGGYLTLSHRWGNAITVKLLKSTCESLHTEIDVKSLPLTFQHAIEVVRRLSERYIWIDSLCIFQDEDDKSDWEREASCMHKVYLHGLLNISATGAEDSSRGLFQNRDALYELSPLYLTCGKPQSLTPARMNPVNYVLDELELLRDALHHAPLASRAWVFQERYLSSRILHFGAEQLFWECNTCIHCERYPDRIPPEIARKEYNAGFKSNAIQSLGPDQMSSTYQAEKGKRYLLDRWRLIIEAYTRTDITFESDRVVAIHGIASALRDVFKTTYIIGFWEFELEGQLLWSAEARRTRGVGFATRPHPWRAPTWSWLSIEGEAFIPSCRWAQFHIQIEGIGQTQNYDDLALTSAHRSIQLKGRLRSCQIKKQDKVLFGAQYLTYRLSTSERPTFDILAQFDIDLDYERLTREGKLFMLPAGTMRQNKVSKEASHRVLVLQCTDATSGEYERVGIAYFDTVRYSETYEELKAADRDAGNFPSVAFDQASQLHTIRVV